MMCVCVYVNVYQDGAAVDNNMKMEVTGKLKKHFTSAQKEGNTTAGVSVIMVRANTHSHTHAGCVSAKRKFTEEDTRSERCEFR